MVPMIKVICHLLQLLSSYQDDVDLSFPPSDPSDPSVRSNVTNIDVQTVTDVEVHFYIFLGCLFCRVKEELEAIYEGKDKATTREALATSWRNHLDAPGVRDRLYDSVVELVCSILPCVTACSNCLIRPVMHADELQAPITETPFRCAGLSIRPGQYTLKDISAVEFMSKFGRPM